jgi:hypothetical protein
MSVGLSRRRRREFKLAILEGLLEVFASLFKIEVDSQVLKLSLAIDCVVAVTRR